MAVPVPLEGGVDAATADAARRNVEGNRQDSRAGDRAWELSGGFLRCGVCGRSMRAAATSNGRGRVYHYYVCSGFRDARSAAARAWRCRNNRSHRADELEHTAARLLEDNANPRALVRLYEEAVRREEERLGIGDPEAARETPARLADELEGLNAGRKGYVRLAARGAISDGELLSEADARRRNLTGRLREAEAAMSARRAPLWSPINAEWFEDPDATSRTIG